MIKKLLLLFIIGIIVTTRIPSVSAAASFSIQPASATLVQSCTAYADVLISVTGDSSNAADIIINYNPTAIEIIDSNALLSGVQILPGSAYESFAGNTVNTSTGTIKLVGYSTTSPFQGSALFAKIQFKPLSTAASGGFVISFSGANPYNTLDSNIANVATSYDLLSNVTNASYTFTAGSCNVDTTTPTIQFVSPTNLQNNVAANAPVTVRLTDAGTGISLSTVSIIINGTTYTTSSAGVTVTGTPSDYLVTVVPSTPFPTTTLSVISVIAADASGNQTNKNITVNANFSIPTPTPIIQIITVPGPTGPLVCPSPTVVPTQPVIVDKTPTIVVTTTITDISQIKHIQFDITDDNGLVPESFIFSLGGITYSLQSTPGLVSFSGDKTHYIVTVTLDSQTLTTKDSALVGYVKITDSYGNTRINNLVYNVASQNAGTTRSPAMISEVLSAAIKTLVAFSGALLIGGLLGVFSISPLLFSVTDSKNGHKIPFARAYIAHQGKLQYYRGDLFGNIHGRLQPGTYLFTIQQFGYSQQSKSITIAHATRGKEIVQLHTL